MNVRSLAVLCLAIFALEATFQSSEAQNYTAPTRPDYKVSIDGVQDTGQFLPGDAVLARVGKKNLTVSKFIDGYFSTLAEFRPAGDSLGRVEFLGAMVNKEVLAAVAQEVNRPLEFEDRTVLREYAHRVLSNLLFKRVVVDSLVITEEDINREYETYKTQVRVRHIFVHDGGTAQQVYQELKQGGITWADAVRKYSKSESTAGEDGELGWITRMGADALLAGTLWALSPGEISEPFNDPAGYHIFQCVELRSYPAPAIEAVHKRIENALRQRTTGQRADALQRRLAEEAGMTYDMANMEWAASHFTPPSEVVQEASGPNITINLHLPHFEPADTSRVLARHDAGVISLGTLLQAYGAMNAAARPPLNSVEAMSVYLRTLATDDRRVDLARSMGLEKDPEYIATMDKREEQLRVEHMYADSIESQIYVTKDVRKAHYEANVHQYMTWASVRFATLFAETREQADSLEALLKSGADVAEMIRADSLAGRSSGAIHVRSENEHGAFHQLVFNELQVGDITIVGPDQKGQFAVLQMLSFDSGRQLSFEEADGYIYESVQNVQAEAALEALLARHKPRYEIETNEALVMRIRLIDPAL